MSDLRLPDFIVIGAMKSGTTALHAYLSSHRDISMPKVKETNYFTESGMGRNTIEWYASQFDSEKKVLGEISPSYAKWPAFNNVPFNIFKVLPDVKIIYVVRNPIERLISELHHGGFTGLITEDVEYYGKSFKSLQENYAVLTSAYSIQLQRYLNYFPMQNIFLLESGKLRHDTARAVNSLCEFLGVEGFEFDDDIFTNMHHVSSEKKVEKNITKSLKTTNLHHLVKKFVPVSLYRTLKYLFVVK